MVSPIIPATSPIPFFRILILCCFFDFLDDDVDDVLFDDVDFLMDDDDDDNVLFWPFFVDGALFFLEVLVDADFAGFEFEVDADDITGE